MSTVAAGLGRYLDWLSEQYRAGAGYLAVLRIAYGLWVLVFPVDYLWVAGVPDSFFAPRLGPAALLETPPDLPVLIGLQAVQAVLAILLVVGYRTVATSLLLSAVMVVGSSIVYSFGKVDHFILFELVPVAMAFAGWGAARSVDARRGRARAPSGFPVLCWGVVVGFALLSAALPKVVAGWLDPQRLGTRGYVARLVADPLTIGPFGGSVFALDSPLLWKALDLATVVVEAGVLVALLYPPLLRLWVLALVGFHVGVYLVMGIDFSRYAFVYVPFLAAPVQWLVERWAQRDTVRAEPPGAVSRTGSGG